MSRNPFQAGQSFPAAALNAVASAPAQTGVTSVSVSTAAGNFDVDVDGDRVFVDGDEASISPATLTLDDPDPDNDRIDLVVVDETGTPQDVTGTPAAEQDADGNDLPVDPPIPADSALAATVYVEAGATEIFSGDIEDEYATIVEPTRKLPLFGDQSDAGDLVISSDQSLDGVHTVERFVVESGVTVDVPDYLIVHATDEIEIQGTIDGSGADGEGGAGGEAWSPPGDGGDGGEGGAAVKLAAPDVELAGTIDASGGDGLAGEDDSGSNPSSGPGDDGEAGRMGLRGADGHAAGGRGGDADADDTDGGAGGPSTASLSDRGEDGLRLSVDSPAWQALFAGAHPGGADGGGGGGGGQDLNVSAGGGGGGGGSGGVVAIWGYRVTLAGTINVLGGAAGDGGTGDASDGDGKDGQPGADGLAIVAGE